MTLHTTSPGFIEPVRTKKPEKFNEDQLRPYIIAARNTGPLPRSFIEDGLLQEDEWVWINETYGSASGYVDFGDTNRVDKNQTPEPWKNNPKLSKRILMWLIGWDGK